MTCVGVIHEINRSARITAATQTLTETVSHATALTKDNEDDAQHRPQHLNGCIVHRQGMRFGLAIPYAPLSKGRDLLRRQRSGQSVIPSVCVAARRSGV